MEDRRRFTRIIFSTPAFLSNMGIIWSCTLIDLSLKGALVDKPDNWRDGEVKNILKAGFIYPIPFTDQVSNIVPVTKKQGTIHISVDYLDLNRACPKDNYPTPFIDQIINECAKSEIFSFMDGFSGYNHINITSVD